MNPTSVSRALHVARLAHLPFWSKTDARIHPTDFSASGNAVGVPETTVSWRALLLAFLKLGAISIGGRSASYLMSELVDRRRWLKREDWQEGLMLGLVLPGPIGASCAMFLATRLRGPRA